jgi:hypothetical protein
MTYGEGIGEIVHTRMSLDGRVYWYPNPPEQELVATDATITCPDGTCCNGHTIPVAASALSNALDIKNNSAAKKNPFPHFTRMLFMSIFLCVGTSRRVN